MQERGSGTQSTNAKARPITSDVGARTTTPSENPRTTCRRLTVYRFSPDLPRALLKTIKKKVAILSVEPQFSHLIIVIIFNIINLFDPLHSFLKTICTQNLEKEYELPFLPQNYKAIKEHCVIIDCPLVSPSLLRVESWR
ncbi:hypothetical protein Pfo_012807 [Paulownia fortunei]|nr:hypothetical protein Pfo_012807 [Paulownia fortunei]